jgi:predicted permease
MSLLSRFAKAFRSDRLNREIDEEQEFHIACRIDELVQDGIAADEAARRARLEFGSRVRAHAESHDAKLFSWLESTRQDIYYGFRTMLQSPMFTAVAILTLALGIGANTAIFSMVNGVLLNPLPYPNADRIVCFYQQGRDFKNGSISYPNFLDWRNMNRSFSQMAAYRSTWFNILGKAESEHVQGEMISAGFFEILHVTPTLGRSFTKDDDRLGATPVAIVSDALWRRRFGSSEHVIGQRLLTDGVQRTIIGVLPASFHLRVHNFQDGRSSNDLYVPIGQYDDPGFYADRSAAWGMDAIGVLKPGITFEQANQDMLRVSRQLAATYPDVDSNLTAQLVPLKNEIVGQMRLVLLVLLSAVFFVLLIACVNVANLLLARSTSRQREFAIRLAVGAGQMRIIRQLLTESLLLGVMGGALGLLIANCATGVALAALPRTLPRANEIGIDMRVLLFTVFVSLLSATLFGLAPALKARNANIGGSLKETGRTVAGTRSRAQRIFVVVEMAMALVLLAGAGLMIRTLFVLWGLDPGFNPRGVMTLSMSPQPSLAKQNGATILAFLRRAHEQLVSTPEVESASLSGQSDPMGSDSETSFWFVGRPCRLDDRGTKGAL